MRKRLLYPLLILLFVACKSEPGEVSDLRDRGTAAEVPFDQTKWEAKQGHHYPFRDQMLNDLVYSDSIRALNKTEILALLGEPDRRTDDHLYYTITQKRLGAWTIHAKSMVIKFTPENCIEWIKIHE